VTSGHRKPTPKFHHVDGRDRVKLQAAHTKLAHSRAFVVRAYKLQTHEMLFDAIAQRSHGVMSAKLTVAEAFRVLGGAPRRGIFDNPSSALTRRHADRRRPRRRGQGAAGHPSGPASSYLSDDQSNQASRDRFKSRNANGP